MKKGFLILCALFSFGSHADVVSGNVNGKITNITSIDSGLLIRVGSNLIPENCTNGNPWLKIDQENTAMTSLTLTAWTLGRSVRVYTAAGSDSYCHIVQVDPYES